MKRINSLIKPYDLPLAITAAAAVLFYVAVAGWGFPLDDSWIHQTYGRNLAQYGEWAFIPGVPSAASTAPLYTVILAAGYLLNVDPLVWSHLIGALSLIVTALLCARMSERLLPDVRYIGLLTGGAVVLTWHLLWSAVSGMETMLFSAFVMFMIHLGWRELDARAADTASLMRRGAIFGVTTALAASLRPEAAMLAGIIGLTLLIVQPHGSLRQMVVWGIGAATVFIAGMLPYFLLNLHLTGGLMPDTLAAKRAELAPMLRASYPERVFDMLMSTGRGAHTFLLPGCIAYVIARLRQPDRRTLLYLTPLLWVVFVAGLYAANLASPFQNGRYMIPVIPAVVLCGINGMMLLLRRSTQSKLVVERVLIKAWVAATCLVYVLYLLLLGPSALQRGVTLINEEMVDSAYWVRDNLPDDGLLVVHDIGAIGYFAPRPLLDIAGLITPEIVPYLNNPDGLWRFMQERDGKYLLVLGEFLPDTTVSAAPRLCPIYRSSNQMAGQLGVAQTILYVMQWEGDCSGIETGQG